MFRPRHFITVAAVSYDGRRLYEQRRRESQYGDTSLDGVVWGAFHARHTAEHRSGEGCGIRPVPLYIRRRRHPVGLRRRRGRDRLGARRTTAVHLHPQSRGDGDRFIRNVHRTGDIGRAAVAGGVTGSLDLRFHADTDAVPERERAAGLPHNGQKR